MGQGRHEYFALVCCLKRCDQLESESPSPGLMWLRVMLRSVTRVQRACSVALTALRTVDDSVRGDSLMDKCMRRVKKKARGDRSAGISDLEWILQGVLRPWLGGYYCKRPCMVRVRFVDHTQPPQSYCIATYYRKLCVPTTNIAIRHVWA
jgi:hypothetical protein